MTEQMQTLRRSSRREGGRLRPADPRISEVSIVESDPRGSVELAAADIETRVHHLLLEACAARPDLLQQDLAIRLGVSEGRVSQVLQRDEMPKLTTFARYMRALGYRIEIHASPAEDAAPDLEGKHRQWWPEDSVVYMTAVSDGRHASHAFAVIPRFVEQSDSINWGDAREVQIYGRVVTSSRTGREFQVD